MSAKTLREKLIGTWLLEQFIDVLNDGTVIHTLGESARGYISYNEDNWVSVQIMSGDRTLFDNPDITGGTPAQLAQAATTYFAYAGNFVTDDIQHQVTHHLHYCLIPNWVGSQQLRHVEFSEHDKVMTLKSDPMVFDGVTHNPALRWRRIHY
ncbi:lipocalin-like domain-containing protein [Dickeya oryzae]|uniref:Lipocalin-like domain-containing protein n=1 Tax=Dickeya oryzae TaxID=1240404 RepID=A0AB39II85_9GAMM|nr:lipocalin-like domain-containing protein [Dickeya oryzae]MBP2859090.1 lipocalin-like domain-containing protein [Dickeya oryzae]MCA6993034.1 lipocalin-like domain-containing protein [Dickeya oryzae]